jgi:hypothetical protein
VRKQNTKVSDSQTETAPGAVAGVGAAGTVAGVGAAGTVGGVGAPRAARRAA